VLQADAGQIVMGGLVKHLAKQAEKMVWRQGGSGGNLVQAEGAVEVGARAVAAALDSSMTQVVFLCGVSVLCVCVRCHTPEV
jgi:hypothetical protein